MEKLPLTRTSSTALHGQVGRGGVRVLCPQDRPRPAGRRAVAGPGLATLVPLTQLYPLGLHASSTTSLETVSYTHLTLPTIYSV